MGDIPNQRKREGGKGQQHLLASLEQSFNEARIKELLDPNLPEGILAENAVLLQTQGLLEVTVKPANKPSGRSTVVYSIKDPSLAA